MEETTYYYRTEEYRNSILYKRTYTQLKRVVLWEEVGQMPEGFEPNKTLGELVIYDDVDMEGNPIDPA